MAVTDDIQTIANTTNNELDAVHDYFEHSKIVWRYFQKVMDQGHRLVAVNTATGSKIDQDGLVRLAPQYTREYLAAFTFRQFVSTFELFLFTFLQRLLFHNPWQFATKQLAFEAVLRATNREEVIRDVILKYLNELKYENIREWFEALKRTIKLDCPSVDEIDQLAEVKAARDILEHNAGIVNEIYMRRAGNKSRHAIGDRLKIENNYHLESWHLLKKVAKDISCVAIERLSNLPAP